MCIKYVILTGWTGRTSTSWRSQHEPMVPPTLPNHGGAIFNGDHHVLYWADSESEIAFVVPNQSEFIFLTIYRAVQFSMIEREQGQYITGI